MHIGTGLGRWWELEQQSRHYWYLRRIDTLRQAETAKSNPISLRHLDSFLLISTISLAVRNPPRNLREGFYGAGVVDPAG